MNWNQVSGSWTQMTGTMKVGWGKLTSAESTTANGHRDQIAGSLQKKFGLSKDEAKKEANEWIEPPQD